jgi:hypothetical protein
METVIIGKRRVDKELFIQSVKAAHKLTDVMEGIGFNPTPSTTRTAVAKAIEDLGLEHSHIRKYGFSQSPEFTQNRIKTFKLSKSNQLYLDKFLLSLNEKSRATYKASCGNFLEALGTNDFTRVSPKRVIDYANQKNTESMKNNTMAHLRSMMIFCVNSNLNEAKEKVSKEMLVWLISK